MPRKKSFEFVATLLKESEFLDQSRDGQNVSHLKKGPSFMPNPKGKQSVVFTTSRCFPRQSRQDHRLGSWEAPKLSGKHRFGNNHEATYLLLITFSSVFF